MSDGEMNSFFKSPGLQGVLDNFISRYSMKQKIYIHKEDLELLPMMLQTQNPSDYRREKLNDPEFFFHLLCYIKNRIEIKTGKILFLTLREGFYIIIDSWVANQEDWDIESRSRHEDFLLLKERYFEAKEKLKGIKSLEDFIIILNHLPDKDIEVYFGKENTVFLKNISQKYREL